MKNILILVLSAVFLLSCNQRNGNKEVYTNNNSTQSADTISKTVKISAKPETLNLSALPDSITVILTNNTTDTITTGLYYVIEKLEDNEWNEVSPKDIVFHDLGWHLKPNDTESFGKKLYKNQIDYKAGKYRIAKYYLKSNYQQTKENYNVYAEFTIED